ncbi:MAG: hypothetical protein R3F17_07795 [Planctomycetota bacterium]
MRAPKPKTQRALPILALIGILGAPMALVAWNTPQETDSVALEEARESLEQLYETRRLISAENRDWITGKELLRDQIRLAQKEMQTLRQNIKDKQAEMEQTLTQVEELKSQSAEATAVGMPWTSSSRPGKAACATFCRASRARCRKICAVWPRACPKKALRSASTVRSAPSPCSSC